MQHWKNIETGPHLQSYPKNKSPQFLSYSVEWRSYYRVNKVWLASLTVLTESTSTEDKTMTER